MQRGRPFFVPKPWFKKTEGEKGKEKPRVSLNTDYIRSMKTPLAEPPAEAARPPRPAPSKPIMPQALKDAAAKVVGTGRLKPNEAGYARAIVCVLAESLRNVHSHDVGPSREEVFGRLVEISLHYPNPLQVLGWFTGTYKVIARMEQAERERRQFPIKPGMENDARRIVGAFTRFTVLAHLDLLLMWTRRDSIDGISDFPIESVCVSPEMLKKVTGETQGESSWGKVPDSPYFRD